MKYPLRRVAQKRLNGSGLIGLFTDSYANVVRAFGEPHFGLSKDQKVRAEWCFSYRGVVFSIYDYKNPLSLDQVTSWHVGGFSSAVRWPVEKQLGVSVNVVSR